MQIGSYEVPEHRLQTAIKDIKVVVTNNPKNDPISSSELGGVWGYKNYSTGIFYRRLNSLLAYGLLSQITKGKFQVTKLGEDLANPESPEMQSQSNHKAVLSVPLWSEIFNTYGKNISDDAFWVQLKKITNIDPVKAKKIQNQIKRWYLDDIANVKDDVSNDEHKGKVLSSGLPKTKSEADEDMETISFDRYTITLPKGDLQQEWNKLKKYMDIKLEDYKYEEQKQEDSTDESKFEQYIDDP